jgi:predicted GIY-YIG superfamily endonuclease
MKQLIRHILREYKKWTEDEIRQVAQKYQKPSDFKNNDKAAYSAANRKGKEFFNDVTSHMDKSYYTFWTDEMLRELAKKFKTKTEFQKAESSAYNSALRKGMDFLNDITSHMDKKKRGKWSDVDLENEAKKYQNKGDFQKYSNSAYIISRNRGKDFFDKITKHMVNQLNYWSDDDLRSEALKYKTKKEFSSKNPQAYGASLRKGEDFHNEITSHMEALHKDWTDESLRKEVSKYETLADFTNFSQSAYQTLKRKGQDYFNEVTKNLNRTISWTDEMLKEEALKYKTRGEFQRGSNVAYQLAKSRGILDDICSHMERVGSKYKRLIYSYEFPDNSVYVGLTYNLNKRDFSHMNRESSSVYQHMVKTGLRPIKKTLTEFLDKDEASRVEGKLTEKYR